jgi:hypothetical protein
VAGQLGGGGVQASDGSLVGNGGDGEVLEHRGANRGVRRSAKDKGSSGAAEITKGGGCSDGCFDSGVVDGELQHQCRQEAVGSGAGFVCGPVEEEIVRRGKGGDGGRSGPF